MRQLERVIASLCRKSVLAIMKDGKRSVKITKKLIVEWLGKEKFEYGVKEKKDQIGVVTGLAYTSFGGDILPVEVTYFDGKGKLIVTGQLGDVMKESTEIALDYVKSKAVEFKIDPAFFDKHDIHIHCPEGAVPKDGPSAGVTLTTALVSAITRMPVHANLAMTGEVTLRGNVLPIGGLREKSLAAHRSGISTVIIPKNNVKDLDEVPEIVKNDIHFIPVETVDRLLRKRWFAKWRSGKPSSSSARRPRHTGLKANCRSIVLAWPQQRRQILADQHAVRRARKALAYVGNTPGKTRLLNFFDIDHRFMFVDVPGDGFANASKQMLIQFGEMMEDYFSSRSQLKGLILLVDMRHAPTEDDITMADYARLLTKCRLRSRRRNRTKCRVLSKANRSTLSPRLWPVRRKRSFRSLPSREQGREELLEAIDALFNPRRA